MFLRESGAWESVRYHSQTKGGLTFGAAPHCLEVGKSVKTSSQTKGPSSGSSPRDDAFSSAEPRQYPGLLAPSAATPWIPIRLPYRAH